MKDAAFLGSSISPIRLKQTYLTSNLPLPDEEEHIYESIDDPEDDGIENEEETQLPLDDDRDSFTERWKSLSEKLSQQSVSLLCLDRTSRSLVLLSTDTKTCASLFSDTTVPLRTRYN